MGKKILLILLLAGLVVGSWYVFEGIKGNSSPISYKAIFATPTPTPVPTAMQKVPTPDGTLTLEMKIDTHADLTKTYTFFIKDNAKNTEKLLFSQSLGKNDSFILPDNSWSPDNKEVFVKQMTGTTPEYIVFKASGDTYANGEQFLKVASSFQIKQTAYTFDSVTGWAAPTLLVVYTKNSNGSTWPHFWFVTDNSSFLQLAR